MTYSKSKILLSKSDKEDKFLKSLSDSEKKFIKAINVKSFLENNKTLELIEEIVLIQLMRNPDNFVKCLEIDYGMHKGNTCKYINSLADKKIIEKKYLDNMTITSNLTNRYNKTATDEVAGLYKMSQYTSFNATFKASIEEGAFITYNLK